MTTRARVFLRLAAVFGCRILSATLCYSQYSGNVQGFVLDPSGAALAGASVTLRNVDTGVLNNTKATDSGNYRFSSLPPGNYVVAASAGGFKKTEVNFTLRTGQTQGIDVHISIAPAQPGMNLTTPTTSPDLY